MYDGKLWAHLFSALASLRKFSPRITSAVQGKRVNGPLWQTVLHLLSFYIMCDVWTRMARRKKTSDRACPCPTPADGRSARPYRGGARARSPYRAVVPAYIGVLHLLNFRCELRCTEGVSSCTRLTPPAHAARRPHWRPHYRGRPPAIRAASSCAARAPPSPVP